MVVRRNDVIAAFDTIISQGRGRNGPSIKWDVIDPRSGERFPPKAVLRIAKEIAGDTSALTGGGWPTNDPLEALGFEIALKSHLEESEEANDVRKIAQLNADETTKQRLISARLGQGSFREALLEMWDHTCPLTGCKIGPVLRASHIMAWRAADNRQRLDPHNGIILAASIDALFDRHLITFTPAGAVSVAATLKEQQITALGLKKGRTISLSDRSQFYMNWHRAESERITGEFVMF